MNLTTNKWIPVVRTNGQADTVNLEQVFSEGGDIRDLAVRPHERIALMRLLLGITHAGLHPEKGGGPLNDKDWRECRGNLGKAGQHHLAEHRKAFELFGDGVRVCQTTPLIPVNQDKEVTSTSKLDVALASGINPTVFDNGGAGERTIMPSELAVRLITFQCFSPGSPFAAALWNGVATRSKRGKAASGGKTYGGDAPCVLWSMAHCLLLGGNLLETIWLNLVDRETVEATYGPKSWGQVVWTRMPASPDDADAVRNATQTYLGRLLPLSRAIRIDANGSGVLLSNGLDYPAWDGDPSEPTATIFVNKQKERKVFPASLDRAIWRDLPSLTMKRRSDGSRGALAWQRFPEDQPCHFWVGALVTNPRSTLKILNTVESIFALPAHAGGEDFVEFYQGGVKFADGWALAIAAGLSAYRRTLGSDIDRRKMQKTGNLMKHKAASHFWTAIETAVREVLIPLAADPPDDLKCDPPYCLDYSRSESRWGPLVRRAAEDAFALACPQASARQAAAFGAGRRAMLAKQPRPNLKPRAAVPEPSTTDTKEL